MDVEFRVHNRKMIIHYSALILQFFPIFQKNSKVRKSSKIHNSTFHGQIQVGFELFEPDSQFRARKPVSEVGNAKTVLFMNQFQSVRQLPRDHQ
jgi:hypothetical protein